MTVVRLSRNAIVMFGEPFNVDSMVLRNFCYDKTSNIFFGYTGNGIIFIPKNMIITYFLHYQRNQRNYIDKDNR